MNQPTDRPWPRAKNADHDGVNSAQILSGTPVDLAEVARLDRRVDAKVMVDEPKYSFTELAELSGWSLPELEQLWLWVGMLPQDIHAQLYAQRELDALIHLRRDYDAGQFDEEAMRTMLRAIGTTMERLSIWLVEGYTQYLAKSQGISDSQARLQVLEKGPAVGPALIEHINNVWLRHYAGAIHRFTTEAVVRRGVSDDSTFPLLGAIGVARMGNFNQRTRDLGLVEYASCVKNFHYQVGAIISRNGGRIINSLGDWVMFAAPNPTVGAEIALNIAEWNLQDNDDEVQVALSWCRVMSFQGDLYGPGVTLVQALSRETPAGQVYLEPEAAAALARDHRYVLTPQPEVELRDLGSVQPTLLQRA